MSDFDTMPVKIAVPARLIRVNDPMGPGKEALTQRVRETIGDDSVIEDFGEPYIAGCYISSDSVDTYYTYMDPDTTLPNFVADATDGVAVLDSHDGSRNGFGRSVLGIQTGDDKQRVISWWYTLPGIRTASGMSTDDYINNIRAKLMKDASVGFFRKSRNAKIECSICGREVMSWDCPHWLGTTYISEDEEGRNIERVALGKVIDHNLSEYSYVYKGANADAEHAGTLHAPEAKVRMYADAGEMTHKQALGFERQYGIAIPNLSRLHDTYPAATLQPKEEVETMAWSDADKRFFKDAFNRDATGDELALNPLDAALREIGAERDAYKDVVPRTDLVTLQAAHDELDRKVKELEPQAANGRAYHESLVADAIAQDIRALPEGGTGTYDRDLMKKFFERATVEELKVITAQKRAAADRNLGAGGRIARDTIDPYATNEPTTTPAETQPRRASHYQAG